MKTIIAASGGVDSTYALWKTLTSTQDDVTAVTLNFNGITPEIKQQYDVRGISGIKGSSRSARVSLITDWLRQNVRDFTSVTVNVLPDLMDKGLPNSPQTMLVNWAVPKINAGEADRIVSSAERENDGYANCGTVSGRMGGAAAAKSVFVQKATRGEIDFMLLDPAYSHAVAMSEMPAILVDLTRSCDRNIEVPCGVCMKCSKRKFFAEALASGKTATEVTQYVIDKSTPQPGRWRSMKYWLAEEVPTCDRPASSETWDTPSWPTSYKVP